MKSVFEKSVLVTAIIFTSAFFVNCNENLPVTNNDIELVNEKTALNYSENNITIPRSPLVFISGYDKGNETFYKNARTFFKEKNFEVVEDQYSLEEIINWLNNNESAKPYGEIHIVNKSNAFTGMTLETVINGETVSSETLRKHITKGTLPILQESINNNSKFIFHANGLGENKELMKTFKDAFCSDELPSVIASPYYSIFDGEFTKHYLAKPYYLFYPTANSPGKVDLSKEIAKKYPDEKDINWLETLNNSEERFIGEAYTTQFTIPLKFELDYHNSDEEVPSFENQDEIIDFIEQNEVMSFEVEQLKIPIHKFRWYYSLHNSTLIIKGKTTGLVVLKPLIKPYGELQYITPDTKNKRLYGMK